MSCNHNFVIEPPSQKCIRLLDAFLLRSEPLLNFRCYELKNLFTQTLYDHSLSEIEIVVWLIFVDEIGIKTHSRSIKEFLTLAALQAKISLGSDAKNYLKHFEEKNPEIFEKLDVWSHENKDHLNISTIKIGKKYRELSMPIDYNQVNYNFILNEVFRGYTVYRKQTIDEVLDMKLKINQDDLEKTFIGRKRQCQIPENQDYDLKDFDRIDS
ncbi:hypothetical protein SteCoe_12633 [Stentor coeruleus]|uniref:Uncharacterized protein n=1 Tax=Stentor coeruleus TaxID=5963 RepID=A0A1R2CAD7_9CILI|nr:hypothetical protein SteCoe_12633 [Stentor coeruleus]